MHTPNDATWPILAFDYGTRRIGVAIAETPLAEPLLVIPQSEHTLETIVDLILSHQAKLVVVGVSEGEMASKSRDFAASLRQQISVPVVEWDETLSTHTAHQQQVESAKTGPRRQEVDHLAAAVILQDFLDDQTPAT